MLDFQSNGQNIIVFLTWVLNTTLITWMRRENCCVQHLDMAGFFSA